MSLYPQPLNPAPWWAGILIALLQAAKTKYPDYAASIDAVIWGLMAHWGMNVLTTLKANGSNGK